MFPLKGETGQRSSQQRDQGDQPPNGQRASQQWDPRDQPSVQYQHQPNPAYGPASQAGQPPPDMATVHSQPYGQPVDYNRLPPPQGSYYPAPPQEYRLPMHNGPYDPHRPPMPNGSQDPYRPQMQNGGQDPYRAPMQSVNQSAPRQRTAIACKYCRRRKIRCSGFDNNDNEGKCSNCVRFNQTCIFTPVSAQAQQFVTVQTLQNHLRTNGRDGGPPQVLYGAYGQPLPQSYPPPGYQVSSPTGPYPQQQMYAPQYPQYPQPGYDQGNRRRPHDEPHTPTLPPPNPGQTAQLGDHRDAQGQGYTYPEPPTLHQGVASPATSNQPYSATSQQPYYTPEPQRRASPQSAYSYENRASASPGYYTGGQPTVQTQQASASRSDGRTSPPPSAASDQGRPGMSIRDIVSENGGNGHSPGERNPTDNDMVSALNRRSAPQNGSVSSTRGPQPVAASSGRRS